ncbi:retrovirus-related pol polyprotein from transposon TNT 1-94 [Tanacetum coccineum]
MDAVRDRDEIEEVNANCIMMANLQQASTSGTQTDKAPVYDSDRSAKQYTELLDPIPEPHQVQQNNSNVIYEVPSMEQGGGTVEQHPVTVEETRAYFESLYNNLAIEVEKVNTVNRKLRETNADLTTELARYKNQEKCFEINQEKYDKLERCYQKYVYQEQCLTKKINALHLSSGKQITTLNKEIANLNNQLSKEKSIVSFLNEEKKKLKSDFKIHEDELLDKQIQIENKIKELDNILVKTGQSIQAMHMLSPNPDLFYHTENKMALGYQNLFYLKQAQQKQQSLYNGKVILEKHDPPALYDSEETLQLAQESRLKMKQLNKEIKPANYAKINQHLEVFVSQAAKSRVEFVVETSDLQTELERTKERFENCVIKKENEYAKLWNDWYKKCKECKYDKISYDKAYNGVQQKIERLQARLGDLKGKCKDTLCVSDTLDPLSQKLENENIELEFQVLNYAKENAHLKTTYKNLFDSISVTRAQTKTIIDSLKDKLYDTIYENAKLKAQLFDKTSEQKDTTKGIDNTAKTRRTQPRSNTKNDRVPSTSKSSCSKNKEVEVEVHPRNLMLSNNKKHMSSECNNIKFAIRNDKSKVFCAMCKQCLITSNHDVCVLNYVNDMNSRVKKINANVLNTANKKKHKPKVLKPKKVGSKEKLASPKPRKPRTCLRWSPTGRIFDLKGKIIKSNELDSQTDGSNGDNACTSNPQEPISKRFPNSTFSLAGHSNLFMVHRLGMLKAHDMKSKASHKFRLEVLGNYLEVTFRRNTCFVRNLEGVDLLKGNRKTNLYTINLHEMASAFPICIMARATSTKSWLWHQRLSHLNFDTIKDLAKNDLVTDLPKFKYHKEHLCPSCEQRKSKKASHPPKHVPNSKQRLHLLHINLCGPMRVESISDKRYVLVIVDDYSRYMWVYFLRSKDGAPKEIKTFLKKITVLLQALVIMVRIDNGTEFKNQVLKEYFDSVGISHQSSSVRTPQQNRSLQLVDKEIIETMIVTFDELSAMAFEQLSSKLGLQSMTSGQIRSGLDLTYAPSTITTQQPTECQLDLLFEAMYDDYIGGQPSAATRTASAAQAPQVLQSPTTSTTIADSAPTPTNPSS